MATDPREPAAGPAASHLDTAGLTPLQRRQAVFAATLGNALEFYDFVTFAFFAIQIGRTFFPSVSPFLSLMGALATFGAGFLSRPLGAYVLGGYADRHGRRPAMMISMMMMGAGILLLGLTPSYAAIGVAAPVIAVAARLVQGFALGGEVGSASVYMMEAALPQRRGFSVSWQGASQNVSGTVGALVGLGLTHALTAAQLDAFGWRLALLLGAAIVPVALVIRRSLPETQPRAARRPRPGTQARAARTPLRPYRRVIALGAVLIAAGTTTTYFFQYMATFGQDTLKLSPAAAFTGEAANNAMAVMAQLLGGALSDRIGRKPPIIGSRLALALLMVPTFLWMTYARDMASFVAGNLLLSFVDQFAYGAIYAAIGEGLPPAIRARAFALVYALPVTVFGGSTQVLLKWLLQVTAAPMAIAWYITAVTVASLVAAALLRESAPARTSSAMSPA